MLKDAEVALGQLQGTRRAGRVLCDPARGEGRVERDPEPRVVVVDAHASGRMTYALRVPEQRDVGREHRLVDGSVRPSVRLVHAEVIGFEGLKGLPERSLDRLGVVPVVDVRDT